MDYATYCHGLKVRLRVLCCGWADFLSEVIGPLVPTLKLNSLVKWPTLQAVMSDAGWGFWIPMASGSGNLQSNPVEFKCTACCHSSDVRRPEISSILSWIQFHSYIGHKTRPVIAGRQTVRFPKRRSTRFVDTAVLIWALYPICV